MAPEGSDPACDILQKPDRNRPGTLHYGRSVFDPVGNRGAHVNARLGDARGAGQRQRIARLVESDVVSAAERLAVAVYAAEHPVSDLVFSRILLVAHLLDPLVYFERTVRAEGDIGIEIPRSFAVPRFELPFACKLFYQRRHLLLVRRSAAGEQTQAQCGQYDIDSLSHNLEVPGSSPGWSTLKIKHLQSFCRCFFFYR